MYLQECGDGRIKCCDEKAQYVDIDVDGRESASEAEDDCCTVWRGFRECITLQLGVLCRGRVHLRRVTGSFGDAL